MYVGHFGIALAANGRRPKLPLALCLVAATAPDLVMGVLGVLLPALNADAYSHSLIAVAALAVIGALGTGLVRRSGHDGLWIGALVGSHLPADWITSRLSLWTHGPVWGLGLYARPGLDLILELAIVVVGWAIYRRGLPQSARIRTLVFAPLVLLGALQVLWNGLSWH